MASLTMAEKKLLRRVFILKTGEINIHTQINDSKPVNNYIIEYCNTCGLEVEMIWDTDKYSYQAYCPYCGVLLMLCNKCLLRGRDICDFKTDFNNKNQTCYRMREYKVRQDKEAE